jgi:RES domain-containing protein
LTRPTLYELVDSLGRTPFRGVVFRHIAPNRQCTSGEGARQAGGRWNPPDSFPTLYTGLSEATVIEEFYRLGQRSNLPPESFLPRTLCRIYVELTAVLDLRSPDNLTAVGLSQQHLTSYSMGDCQGIGEAAHKLGLEGILAPSATAAGDTLVIFELNLNNDSIVQEQGRTLWPAPPSRST